ncbi:MAG TPA: hypothetical protein DIU18_03350 [Gemmatimonadetes bacterium]|nr:hypothetical protein [Gemmatimonadota bacterium]
MSGAGYAVTRFLALLLGTSAIEGAILTNHAAVLGVAEACVVTLTREGILAHSRSFLFPLPARDGVVSQ